ncbi:MAG: hypothetical protein K6D94_11050 [Clostridiales bacterium]|nr:hypothetical protein [Clostridiales bacterium]
MNVQPLDLLQGQVAVNNTLASSLGFGVTTDKVFDGTWTFDAMLQMIQAAAADIDGSGTMDQNDQYGFIGGVGNINPMIVGAERKYIVTDNGQMRLNYGSEGVIAAAGKMDPIINNKATSVYLNEQSWGNDVWKSGRALLIGVMVGTFYNDYRSLELDISLLPVPKYDEQQEKYHSMLSNCSMGVTVPASASDPERTGNIVEALNAYSYITMNEVYYETTLQIKLARDDASQKILEIIVNSKTPDLAVFNENAWGNIITDFLNSFHKNGASQLASLAEKNAEKFQKIAEKIVGEYEALE